jgi:hypothetical protein
LQISPQDQPMSGNETMNRSEDQSLMIMAPATARDGARLSRYTCVSSSFVVQMAASAAGIGPYRTFFRERPAIASACYRAADMRDRCRG